MHLIFFFYPAHSFFCLYMTFLMGFALALLVLLAGQARHFGKWGDLLTGERGGVRWWAHPCGRSSTPKTKEWVEWVRGAGQLSLHAHSRMLGRVIR